MPCQASDRLVLRHAAQPRLVAFPSLSRLEDRLGREALLLILCGSLDSRDLLFELSELGLRTVYAFVNFLLVDTECLQGRIESILSHVELPDHLGLAGKSDPGRLHEASGRAV